MLVHSMPVRSHTHTRDAQGDTRSWYGSVSSIFGCDLWLLFSRGHSHLGDDGHIDLINSFIYRHSPPFILTLTHTLGHVRVRTHTHAHRYAAKTHRFTAGITQLSASSIPHLLHVCFSVSLLFLFSSPQATSPSPRLSTRFNPFLFCPRSRSFYQHPLPVTCFSPPMFSPTHRGLFVSPFSSTSLHAKVVSLFASVSQQASDSNMWGGWADVQKTC